MNVYFNDKNILTDIRDKKYYTTICNSISREIFDNEFLVLDFAVLGDVSSEKVDINFCVDALASNLDKNNLPNDVTIFSVINSDIVSYNGKKIKNELFVSDEEYTHIFIGIDCSYLADESNINIDFVGESSHTVKVHLLKNGSMLRNKGADRVESLSRLCWLNSQLFENEKKSFVYDDVEIDDNIISLKDKKVELYKSGYIKNVYSYIDDRLNATDSVQAELLDGGIRLLVDDNVEYEHFNIERVGANIILHSIGDGDSVKVCLTAKVKYTGVITYHIDVIAKEDTIVDVSESNLFSKYASKYINGLGHKADYFEPFNYKWNGRDKDSIFVGNVNVGATIKWINDDVITPINTGEYNYRGLIVPSNWDNNKSGGIDVLYERERASVNAYTGKIKLVKGEKKTFSFEVYLTPFHALNRCYNVKHYENNRVAMSNKRAIAQADKAGCNVAILHYNSAMYKDAGASYNYPIKVAEEIKEAVANPTKTNIGIYYNLDYITAHAQEIKALADATDDILVSSATNNNSEDEYVERYIGKYYITRKLSEQDSNADMQLMPMSRYNNYYVEMVNWLAKECGIKGIEIENGIIDDITLERVRKALDRYDGHIDMILRDSNVTKYSSGSAIDRVTPLLPYIDTMLTGEGMVYRNMSPEELLLEVSGLPYGISTDMIDVDPFIGMLYGISSRSGYNDRSNAKLYKLWDKFDIEGSEMVGWWSEDALHASDDNVKITYYKKESKALICMYNFNNYPAVFTVDYSPLNIDGIMRSFPMSKLIMNQKFNTNTTVVIYNKCGLFMLADIK